MTAFFQLAQLLAYLQRRTPETPVVGCMTKVNLIALNGITKYAKALNTIEFAASLTVDAALPSYMCATEQTSI
jgi:hypothetical protein